MKEEKKNTAPAAEQEGAAVPQDFPGMVRKKKKKRDLIVPSRIIRWFMIFFYVVAIFLLSSGFISVTMYITEDLEVTPDSSKAYMKAATQDEVDAAADKLQKALDGLKKNDKEVTEYHETMPISTVSYNTVYHVSPGIKTDKLRKLINKARDIDRRAYTEKTVKALNTATIEAQKTLCTEMRITQSALQLILGGSIADAYQANELSSSVSNNLMILALAILPVVGFFFASFDRTRHLKNIYTASCAVLCVTDIMIMIYPYIALGSVLSIFVYIALFVLSGAGFYAKQQEDHIVKHPELEAEFTQQHPYFVKALLNYKRNTMPEMTKKEQTVASAQNAKKHGRSRK